MKRDKLKWTKRVPTERGRYWTDFDGRISCDLWTELDLTKLTPYERATMQWFGPVEPPPKNKQQKKKGEK